MITVLMVSDDADISGEITMKIVTKIIRLSLFIQFYY